MSQKKVIIVAPFWDQPPHVGIYRVQRYIHWFKNQGFNVIILKSDVIDNLNTNENILTISVADRRLKLSKILYSFSKKFTFPFLHLLWNKFIYVISVPDEYTFWGSRVIKNKTVLENIHDANIIISTSPPNSSIVLAKNLSKKFKIPLIVDMRDGWLDEPLRNYLRKNGIRKRIEERLEREVLESANKIIVTSDSWKDLLCERYPHLRENITVITNAYPEITLPKPGIKKRKVIRLIYAGNYLGDNRMSRLEALLIAFDPHKITPQSQVQLDLYGKLGIQGKKTLNMFSQYNNSEFIKLNILEPVSRMQLLKEMMNSDGLILPSISKSAIPSKMFEYILTEKPILAITELNSAVWNLGLNIPQVCLFEVLGNDLNYDSISKYLSMCSLGGYSTSIPKEYSVRELEKKFTDVLHSLDLN